MSQNLFKNKRVEYPPSNKLQRRNPICKVRFKPILCKLCEEKQKDSRGRKKYWNSINRLWGHCSFDHKKENFSEYLVNLAEKILRGDLR